MSESTNVSTPPATQETWLVRLSRYPNEFAIALFAATIVLMLVPAWIFYKYRDELFWVAVASVLLPLTTLAAAVWQKVREPGKLAAVDATRLLILALGGVLGLNLLLVSLAV